MRFFGIVLGVLLAGSATAQEIRDCREFNQGVIIDPTEMKGRTYANGEVTIAVVHDGRDRSSDSLFVLVYAPDSSKPDEKQCRMIGNEDGRGYADVRLNVAQAEFTAAAGLTVLIPARTYSMYDGDEEISMLSVNVSRAAHEISVTKELGIQ